MQFSELNLIEPLLRAVHAAGYTVPTPIQAGAIPPLLTGRDLLGCAQTGTGKTAAFALPILQALHAAPPATRGVRVLVLAPTRELASQIAETFRDLGRYLPAIRTAVIFGGVGQTPQVQALRAGIDVLVATPGRLLDLAGQGFVNLKGVEHFVLDEADRMLDMGFIHDVRKVIKLLPTKRRTMLFSATIPAAIQDLSGQILHDPVRVSVTPPTATADRIDQAVHFVPRAEKRYVLAALLKDPAIERALVFTRTKHGANRLTDVLLDARIGAAAIHGNKSQSARERALESFRRGETRVLVATDIAARGIDVAGITHVFNYDLPNEPETYVHRIGRTARAGAAGFAVSLCDPEERPLLRDIERLIRQRIPEPA